MVVFFCQSERNAQGWAVALREILYVQVEVSHLTVLEAFSEEMA
jgi:hypothetical protein